MDIPMVILRILHIVSGIFWVGTTFFFVLFFEPTIKVSGPAGGTVMGRLALTRFPLLMSVAAILTTLAGFVMYWIDSKGFETGWIFSAPGAVLTIGSLAGILAFIVGGTIQMPSSARLGALQKEIQAAGSPPTSAQLEEMSLLQARITKASRWGAVLMLIAVLGMTMARELGEL